MLTKKAITIDPTIIIAATKDRILGATNYTGSVDVINPVVFQDLILKHNRLIREMNPDKEVIINIPNIDDMFGECLDKWIRHHIISDIGSYLLKDGGALSSEIGEKYNSIPDITDINTLPQILSNMLYHRVDQRVLYLIAYNNINHALDDVRTAIEMLLTNMDPRDKISCGLGRTEAAKKVNAALLDLLRTGSTTGSDFHPSIIYQAQMKEYKTVTRLITASMLYRKDRFNLSIRPIQELPPVEWVPLSDDINGWNNDVVECRCNLDVSEDTNLDIILDMDIESAVRIKDDGDIIIGQKLLDRLERMVVLSNAKFKEIYDSIPLGKGTNLNLPYDIYLDKGRYVISYRGVPTMVNQIMAKMNLANYGETEKSNLFDRICLAINEEIDNFVAGLINTNLPYIIEFTHDGSNEPIRFDYEDLEYGIKKISRKIYQNCVVAEKLNIRVEVVCEKDKRQIIESVARIYEAASNAGFIQVDIVR